MMKKPRTGTNGFTLLELAIVLLISGILTAALMIALKNYNKEIQRQKTLEAVASAKIAVERFFATYNRYPCPANAALPITDINYGREDCTMAPVLSTVDKDGAPGNDPVLIGMFPIYGFQSPNPSTPFDEDTNGNRILDAGEDLNGNGKLDTDEDANNNFILDAGEDLNANGVLDKPGMRQYMNDTDRFSYNATELTDAWNDRLTYAVSKNLAVPPGKFDGRLGVIKVVDEFDNDTGGTNSDAHYLIVSHGADRMGARHLGGGNNPACDAAYTNEAENCDGDTVFRQSLHALDEQNKARYYDDYIDFSQSSTTDIWGRMLTTSGAETESMYALNAGNVGINTATPTAKLDVAGAVRATTAIRSAKLCNGTECVDPKTIYNIDCDVSTTEKTRFIKSVTIDTSTSPPRFQVSCGGLEFAPVTNSCPSGRIKTLTTMGQISCY